MKKILSSLLAFAMVLALFSGVIVFNASADDTQEFHIPFINQYTLAQAQQMAKGTNGTVSFDKTGDGKTVIIGTTGATASWGNYYFQFDTAKGIDQWAKNALVDGIKIFKGADFSNKSAIAVKFADVDGYDATASIDDAKGMFLTLGSSTKAVAIDFKNPTKQNGYFYFDFTGAQFVGASWYYDCPTFKDAFFHTIDQTKVQINMNVGEAKLAFVVEDMYLVGRNDTEKLGELIVEAEAEGIDCTAERELYFSDTATQDDVDAAAAALNTVLHPYEYYDLVGFTQTTQAELDTLSGNIGYVDGKIYNAVVSKLELTENAGEIKLTHNPASTSGYTQSIVTYVKSNGATLANSPWTPVDASKKLGDMDGIRFKLTDADGKPVSFYGQYRFVVQASGWGNYWYYRGKPSIDEDGYNFIDFGRIYRASTTNTEQLLSDELNKLDGISFLMYGAPETVYFSDFQGYVRNVKRSEGLEFVDLPGFNDWTQDNLDLTNAAALADSGAVGTAMQFYDKAGVMRGNSTHGLLPTKDYKPNNYTQIWGTQTSTDTAAEQQNGDVFGAYKAIGELQKYDGIRIGISTTATGGGDPVTYSWDGHKRVNISFKLVGSGQKAFNNTWYPTFSCDYSCASGELFPNYEDGYLYFYFDDMKSGWADQVLSQYANTTQLYGNFQMSYVGGGCNTEWKRLVVSDMQLFRNALADPTEGLWAPNYTEESWAALEAAVEARDVPAIAEAKANLKPAVIDLTTDNMMQGWTTENVNAPVTLNADRLCDSIGDGLNAPNVWNGGDFSNNTVFEANNNFSMTATADFTGKSMGWKNLDRTTMNTASAGAYPILNTVGIENGAGIRFKLDVEGGSFERLLVGLSNCGSGGNKEMYVTKILPDYFDEEGYINLPFSAFEKAWWGTAFTEENIADVKVLIVEAYGVTDGTKLTISDLTGYKPFDPADYVGDLWEYNYTSDSWAAVQAAAEAGDKDALIAAKAALEPLFVKPVTGNFFEGWTTRDVNNTVNANSGKLCDSIGDGLNAPNVWNNGDFSNNTSFEANNNFSMMATADFTGKSMGWKNMDRSKTLQTADNGAYPAMNVTGLSKADGVRFKIEVEDGTAERLLIGLSNCSKFVREMYATQIKPEYAAEDGYINIPFSVFEKAWWCDAFAQNELEDVIVFIIEAYNVSKFTTIRISDMYGYVGRDFDIDEESLTNLWQYNYTADSWAAYEDAIAAAKTVEERDAALALLAPYETIATTDSFFKGWTNEAVNAVVTANSDKLCDSIGEGLNINNAWNAGDFSRNTTFAIDADGAFVMTATADFTGKAMGWKNMDRSETLQPDKNGAYPALTVAGLSKAEGIRLKIEANKPIERILIGLSNCSKFVREMYAMKIKPEFVAEDGYINIPFSYFEKAFWCSAFAQDELEDVIVFIVEAYGAEEGTELKLSDVRGYRALTTQDLIADLWESNYTDESWAALQTAVNSGDLDATRTAIGELVLRNVKTVTEDFFTGWTTEAVNAVVTANSDKLCDSIGEGLNINNAWNAGDFSRNTTFAIDADGAFVMTATADFTGKAMGWKNMDRSETLQPDKNGAYPALTVAGLSKAEGIRLKIEANKPIERILIGLSNCSKFVREMYAMKIKPEFVAEDGYINIPFSYFEKAFWCNAFAQDELEDVIVFIVEAYGAEEGTELKLADVKGYTTIVPPSAEEIAALEAVIATLKADDIDNRFAADITAAEATKTSEDHDDVLDATAAIQAIVDELESDGRPALKEAISKVDATKYPDEVAAGIAAYYDETATADDVAAATKALQRIIDQPAAPTVTYEVTDSSITVTAVEGAEYKLGTGEWQDSNVFENLGANVEYQLSVRIKATDDFIASEATVVNVTTAKTSFGEATVTVSGTEKYDETLTATVADVPELIGTNYTIEWHNADGEKIGTGETYVLAADEIGTTVYAELVSDVASDTVKSDATGTIGKGVIKNYTLPTAGEITYPQTLADSVLSGGDTGTVTGTWAWAAPETRPLISQSGSLFAITFTPDAAFADLYEGIEADIAVTVNAPAYGDTTFTDVNGMTVSGQFMAGVEMHVEPIGYAEPAYQSLLRASSKDTSGLKKLVLFKRITFTYNGEEITDLYTGGLTVTSFVGANRAGQDYSTWFFVGNKPTNFGGTVDPTGLLVVENVIL